MKGWQKRIIQRMDDLDMTQEILSEKIGNTAGAVRHWLKGRRTPRVAEFELAAEALGVSPEWLLYGVTVSEDALSSYFKILNEQAAKYDIRLKTNHEIKLASKLYNEYGSNPPETKTIRERARQLLGVKL